MPQTSGNENYSKEYFSWETPEYEKHERTKLWYIEAIIIALLLLLFAFLTGNFLFAVIIIITSLIIILHDSRDPDMVEIRLTDEGIVVGRKFYDYDEFKDFSIVYKPKQGVKKLYLEFKNVVRPRISINLENMNPLPIRETLLKYLSEDLEQTDQHLSESLAKIFKL